jgi:hypothetical protein
MAVMGQDFFAPTLDYSELVTFNIEEARFHPKPEVK